MGTVALLTLQKVAMLLLFISIGFVLRKSGKLPKDAGKVLSMLTTLVFCPAYNFRNLSKNLTIDNVGQKLPLLGLGAVMIVLVILFASLLARLLTKDPFKRRSLSYAFSIPNYGYFGYPVVEGVFGSAALADMMIFAIPTSIATNTWGYLQFSKEKKLSWKKVVFAPMILAVFFGIVFGLSGIKLPGFVDDVLAGAGSCMSPVSMVLAGFVLGGLPLKKLLSGWKAYMYGVIRLLVVPLVFGVPLYFLGLRGNLLMIPLLILSLPLGLNLVVFPESYGYDATDNAQMCFVSYLLSILILPCTFAVINFLAFG